MDGLEIILAMMLWISSVTGYTIPELPQIIYLSSVDIKKYAYGCDKAIIPPENKDICDAQEFWDLDDINNERAPIALYDNKQQHIILNEKFNIETVHDQSVLLHELIHHVQLHNGVYKKVKCKNELEAEAYELHDKWLREKYGVTLKNIIGINELFLIFVTTCQYK